MKISLEQAKNETLAFLQAHDLETDTATMLPEDVEDFEDMVSVIAKSVSQGRAIIDGEKFTLTLKRPQGDLTSVTISGMSAADMFAADKAKKNDDMAKSGHMIASMVKVPFAQVAKLSSQEFMLLSKISQLFIVV